MRVPFPVDLICQNSAGIMPFPLAKPLCHVLQIASLFVDVEGEAFQSGSAVYHTDVLLRAKFHRFANRTQKS